MRPMTVWLYELLDASMTYGDKKGMFRQAGTNTTSPCTRNPAPLPREDVGLESVDERQYVVHKRSRFATGHVG